MLKRFVTAYTLALGCSAALAAGGHDLKPKHGGVVQEVKDITYELVVHDGRLVLHLDDHGKPVSTKGASGRATLLSGADKTDVELAPAGENRLEGRALNMVGAGAKVVTVITLPGKPPATARFTVK